MPDNRLPTPIVDVTLDDGSGETTTLRAQIVNADMVRWDRTAAKHGWPKWDAAPFLWLTFVSWAALRRSGQIGDDMTWELYEQRALHIATVDGADPQSGLAPIVDPTLSAREPG